MEWEPVFEHSERKPSMTGELRKPVLPSATTHPHRRRGVLSYGQTGAGPSSLACAPPIERWSAHENFGENGFGQSLVRISFSCGHPPTPTSSCVLCWRWRVGCSPSPPPSRLTRTHGVTAQLRVRRYKLTQTCAGVVGTCGCGCCVFFFFCFLFFFERSRSFFVVHQFPLLLHPLDPT